MPVIDLTLPLDANTLIHTEMDSYRDATYGAKAWATIPEHGYNADRSWVLSVPCWLSNVALKHGVLAISQIYAIHGKLVAPSGPKLNCKL